jgi:EAL domain-containing protein (putative c-di-GMP-specific phosphodiesterase class I)/ABC-type nitrate/sulfonate/bicarbonate transport system substrate-binding protein
MNNLRHTIIKRLLLCILLAPAMVVAEPVDLYLKWYHKAQFAGIYMAEVNGYFVDEGLEVNIVSYDPQFPPLLALKEGIAEYSLQDPEIFSQISEGLDFVTIATYGQQSPWTLAVDHSIKSIKDLSGKTILVPFGHADKILAGIIKAENLLDVAVQPYQTPAEFKYLISTKSIQAILGYRSNEAYFFQKIHPDARFFDPTIVGYNRVGDEAQPVRLYSDMLVATRDEATNNPERAAAMIRAVNRGWEYVIKNPAKSLDTILKHYFIESSGFDREQSAFELEFMIKTVALPSVPIGSQSTVRWEMILDYYRTIGIVSDEPIDLSHYIWDGRLLESKIKTTTRNVKETAIGVAVFFLTIMALLLFIYRKNLASWIANKVLLRDIRRGIKAQEFIFHFQPIVRPSGEIVSAEALVRWAHPSKGLTFPDYFIDAIEQDLQLVQKFDLYVIENVLKSLSEMPHEVIKDLTFSINVSIHFFSIPQFDAKIIELGNVYGISLKQLDIELTERLSVSHFEDLASSVKRLKNIGLSVTLDDYGTGYTSLNMLNIVPFDKLKIDKSLIDLIEHSERARGTLKSIHMLAGVHNMSIVCEGLESSDQVMVVLNEIGGYSLNMQGYYYSKPLPWDILQYGIFPLGDQPVRRVGKDIIDPDKIRLEKLHNLEKMVANNH